MRKRIKPQRHKDTKENQLFAFCLFDLKKSLRLCVFVVIIFFSHAIQAQSTDQNFPTAVTTNQISGTIKARDVGDSRLTTYYYIFGGGQGDIFINVVTKNFDGDIDVFTLNGLKPLTKIKVFSDSSDNETGRIVYLRQPEKLILRVEGRSPNDEPASFQIKFAGSFVAEKAPSEEEKTDVPQVKTENEGEVRVNSVGTIIPKPKPSPKPSETPAKTEIINEREEKAEEKETVKKEEEKPAETKEKPSVEVIITDNLEKPKEEKKEEKAETKTEENKTEEKAEVKSEESKTEETPKKEVNPLENIKLTVVFKDGTKIERPMSEILNVNVDKGVLTIIEKDGTIGRYSLLDIVEFTIK